jgi:hypothetical protein
MPFTPLHLGPVFVFGLFLRRWLHLPTLIVASIAVDVEPLLVIVLKLDYPLHGYLHTFLFAIPYGIAVGYAMIYLEKPFNSLYKALLLEEAKPIDKKTVSTSWFNRDYLTYSARLSTLWRYPSLLSVEG